MLRKNFAGQEAAFATLIANYDRYKRVFSPTATLTLTQSGLLAALLERQRYKLIESARRRIHREQMRAAIRNFLKRHFTAFKARILHHCSSKPVLRTIPRHT